jgi:hypothetical protein
VSATVVGYLGILSSNPAHSVIVVNEGEVTTNNLHKLLTMGCVKIVIAYGMPYPSTFPTLSVVGNLRYNFHTRPCMKTTITEDSLVHACPLRKEKVIKPPILQLDSQHNAKIKRPEPNETSSAAFFRFGTQSRALALTSVRTAV